MKSRRLILFACVFMLSFAGVGYSAWTEGLSIKSFFATGEIHVVFEAPMVEPNGQDVINVDASEEGVLDIEGTVAPGTTEVVIEYDIYNGSSIPIKYNPDDDALLEGITLDQSDNVIEPGGYLRGNQLTIIPGKNELILPFVQYNSKDGNGWKEELTIRWNIEVAKEILIPEIAITSEDAITIETPIEDIPPVEEPEEQIENDPPAEEPEEPFDEVPPSVEPEEQIEEVPPSVEPEEPFEDVPSDNPVINENVSEDNAGSDEGSDEGTDENVTGGEK